MSKIITGVNRRNCPSEEKYKSCTTVKFVRNMKIKKNWTKLVSFDDGKLEKIVFGV